MIEASCKKIIFSSTCAIFDSTSSKPIDENCVLNPITPYAESKLVVERLLHYLWQADKIQYVCLRFFNAAGADVDGDIGECHRTETHLLPLAIKSSLGSYVLKIFGTDYPTPDGTPIRDYIHVADLADAHILAVQYLDEGNSRGLFNLGSGTGYSVFEILDELARAGLKAKYEIFPPRQGDSHYLVANPNLAKTALKWIPGRSNIKTIIETAVKWHKTNGF
jgi:UDP-glucose 4-epimerase